MKRYAILILVILLMSGCVTVGRKIDQSATDKIKKGETTREEVVASIGSPDQITRLSNGDMTFTYHYMRATPTPQSFIPVIGPLVSGSNVQNQTVIVTFGPDNIVKDIFSTQGSTSSRMGIMSGSGPEIPDVEKNKRPE